MTAEKSWSLSPWDLATLYNSFAAAAMGVDWDTDSAKLRASLRSCHKKRLFRKQHKHSSSTKRLKVSLNPNKGLSDLQTFCWCFKGKAVGYWDLIIDGPFILYIGALMAPWETTCNFTMYEDYSPPTNGVVFVAHDRPKITMNVTQEGRY